MLTSQSTSSLLKGHFSSYATLTTPLGVGGSGLSLVAVTVVVVVGADRILLGVHNLSDVIGGYAVGGVWLALMTLLLPPFHDRPAEP